MRVVKGRRRALVGTAVLAVLATAVVAPRAVAESAADRSAGGESQRKGDPVLFFAADGMRQDIIERYVDDGDLPAFKEMLRRGASASGDGMLTQAPPNTGSGWYTMATGAWPGVHGSTNNTFHTNSQPFTASTSGLNSPGVLQAETIAQSAERGGKKVLQMEWAGGRNGAINGPTVDFRSFLSGRGVTTNYVSPTDRPNLIASFGLQYDQVTLAPATGWTNVPASDSPALETHMRVLDFGVDKYGLDAYIYDSRSDGRTNYDRVLFSRGKDGTAKVADLREGEFADIKVSVVGGALGGKTASMLIRVEELSRDATQVRLFHTSVTRANATWAGWPGEAGFTGDFAEYVAQTFPSTQAGDFAVLEAGIVSEETYMEQALYWETGHHPLLKYLIKTYQPDLALVGYPVTDEVQHQFTSLVTPTLPNDAPNPAYDDVTLDGFPDGRVDVREAFIKRSYEGAEATMRLAQDRLGKKTTTFVGADHGFAPQFLAIDASKVLVDLKLLSTPQTSNCRPATGETIGKAKACWAGGAVQIYLNQAGRNPVTTGLQQVPAAEAPAVIAQIKAAFQGLTDPNDWTGDGQPEGWKVIDRIYTQAEARSIPNGPGAGDTTDMAHPTRTGDLVVFAYPPYQYDAATPGTLVAKSEFFGQHGYVPDVQDLEHNINMRAAFLAGGPAIDRGEAKVRIIDVAPTIAYLMGVPEPQQSQGKVLLDILRGGDRVTPVTVIGLNDFHGQLDPTTLAFDGVQSSVGGAGQLATLFDEDAAALPGPALRLAGGDNVGASPPNSGLLEDRPAIDVENAWPLDATSYGNHEFDYGVTRLLQQQEQADFPFLATNIVEDTGEAPDWVTPSVVRTVNGVKIGIIGAGLEDTPELVSAGATAGLKFLPAAGRIEAESERLRGQGVRVQIVLIHEGSANGVNRIGANPATAWDGPVITIAKELEDSTVDAIVAGHTHRASNVMVGDILVTEGINAGASYSVLQLMVSGRDVAWAGGATRIARNLGVASRPDVKTIVDAANAETAVLRNQVIGTQLNDILRDLTRLNESEMGNLVADAMRAKYPGIDAAITNSGGLRADFVFTPPSAAEQPGEITWGEVFAVLPFGNRTTLLTLTGAQIREALLNGFSPVCNSAIATGRFPQVSGLKITFGCNGTTPVVNSLELAPDGPAGPLTPIADGDLVRIVTNDFMYTGGDGYTVFAQGTDVGQPGDALLDVVVQSITDNSPVDPAVDGRIVRTP